MNTHKYANLFLATDKHGLYKFHMSAPFGLMLYCDPAHADFALQKAGVPERKNFPSMEEALDFVSLMVLEDTPVTIVDRATDSVRHLTAHPRW